MTSKKDIRAQVRQAFAGRTAESLAIASEAACASVLAYIDSLAGPCDSPARPGDSPAEPCDSLAKPCGSLAKSCGSLAKSCGSLAKPGDSLAKPGDSLAKPCGSLAKPCGSPAEPGDSPARPGDSLARRGMTILLYWALPDEVQTASLVDTLSRAGHTVLLPVVVGDELELRVYRGLEAMSPGPFGILEPQLPDPASSPVASDSCAREAAWPSGAFTDYQAIDLAIVPGRAFTADGARLGRGRGYYDRLLPQLACPKVGLCFSWQIVPAIPMDPHDIPMDHVICR